MDETGGSVSGMENKHMWLEHLRAGNPGAPGMNVGDAPEAGVDAKVGVGEEGSLETI